MTWTLTVTLLFAWGLPDRSLVLVQGKAYDTVEECLGVGSVMVEWLTQDGVEAIFTCTKETHNDGDPK